MAINDLDLLKLPKNFITLNDPVWNKYTGKLSGSAQPGCGNANQNDELLLKTFEKSHDILNFADQSLFADLTAIYNQGIRVIYSLVKGEGRERNPMLIKKLWKNCFKGTSYITEINNQTIQIKDFTAPNQVQLNAITADVIQNLASGKNILIHCHFGIGRTGTILAAIYMKAFHVVDVDKAIKFVRATYNPKAVEVEEQKAALEEFSKSL